MKPLPLIILAILIHVTIKYVWDFFGDIGDNLYYTGYAFVMLLWVIVAKIVNEDRYLNIVITFWLFWALNDFLKELAHALNILQWLFANPLVKHLSEYIVFGFSAVIAFIQYRRLKRAE